MKLDAFFSIETKVAKQKPQPGTLCLAFHIFCRVSHNLEKQEVAAKLKFYSRESLNQSFSECLPLIPDSQSFIFSLSGLSLHTPPAAHAFCFKALTLILKEILMQWILQRVRKIVQARVCWLVWFPTQTSKFVRPTCTIFLHIVFCGAGWMCSLILFGES